MGYYISIVMLALTVCAIVGFCAYFRGQRKAIDKAIETINRFLSGDTGARIESDGEGGLNRLFHAVNTLATTLNAHAVREQNTKDFLRNTISDISHQLKTPLAALTIYHSLLREEWEDRNAVCEFALKSEKEIERIETLVRNLLKITKLDAGSIFMDKHAENVSDMMHDMKAYLETRAEREEKENVLSGAPDIALYCDRDWLTEAIGNIVKNALDHMNAGGQVRISWKRQPSISQIVITDNGSGIHPEDIHHIFKRFYRSRFSQDIQGIGLGLPLAQAIIEAHDGNITAESVFGGGSAFTVNFLHLTQL